ncbi:MAG: adenylate/guanylate cyclase domain-containing protein, partial [Phycisphaeraceae bacterium JB051]
KFLGDGIMFFYSAPRDNPQHAIASVRTALEMQHAMVDFNRRLHSQDLPQVSVRIGISTGNMVVGNAGSIGHVVSDQDRASDYTVLGDSVNLGARLESANKYTGTAILINDTCKGQLGDIFLLRPVGKLQVVGKSESIMTWEPLCLAGDATDRLTQVATLSEPIVDMFAKGLFAACDQAIVEYEKTLGDDKFSAFYHRQCDRHREHPDEFNGCIVLEAK